MPPLEVYAGLEDLPLPVSDKRPSREQLAAWIDRHDQIEREAEQFDAGDMRKLRKFAKAATQRNLSPSDTDLIEVTLDTLVALDKLLHLLRSRSDKLELITLRLDWEDLWRAALRDMCTLQDDIRVFLESRARWSPTVYDSLLSPVRSPGSSISVSPQSSIGSSSAFTSSLSARSQRYKHVEILSHDAAHFSSRTNTLKQSKIVASGKMLDKLIDTSRNPVPDRCLDEQDSLENQFNVEVAGLAKFVMNVVMQWKKSDELYGESIKDQKAARALIEELEEACKHHPSSRLANSFASQAQTLSSRTAIRGDPSSLTSSFPRPQNPIFPEQTTANATVIECLASEILKAKSLAQQAQSLVQQYQLALETVQLADQLKEKMEKLTSSFERISERIRGRDPTTIPKGDLAELVAPSLDSVLCLEHSRHTTYIALFTTITSDLQVANSSADALSHQNTSTLSSLSAIPAIDKTFIQGIVQSYQNLDQVRALANKEHDGASSSLASLKAARKVWDCLVKVSEETREIHEKIDTHIATIANATIAGAARFDNDRHSATPPPERLTLPGISDLELANLQSSLQNSETELQTDVSQHIMVLMAEYGTTACVKHLHASQLQLMKHISDLGALCRLLKGLLTQMSTLEAVNQEGRTLEERFLTLLSAVESSIEETLLPSRALQLDLRKESEYRREYESLNEDLQYFLDILPTRISFTSGSVQVTSETKDANDVTNAANTLKLRPTVAKVNQTEIDRTVRNDVNNLAAMLARLPGEVESQLSRLHVSFAARAVDEACSAVHPLIDQLLDEVLTLDVRLTNEISSPDAMDNETSIASMADEVERCQTNVSATLENALKPIRKTYQHLVEICDGTIISLDDWMVSARTKDKERLDGKCDTTLNTVISLRHRVVEALQLAEGRRLEKMVAARAVDEASSAANAIIAQFVGTLATLGARLTEILASESGADVASLANDVEHCHQTVPISLENALKPVRDSYTHLVELCNRSSTELISSRTADIDRLESEGSHVVNTMATLRERVVKALQDVEAQRLAKQTTDRLRKKEIEAAANAVDQTSGTAQAIIVQCLETVATLDAQLAESAHGDLASLVDKVERFHDTIQVSVDNAMKTLRYSHRHLTELCEATPEMQLSIVEPRSVGERRLEGDSDRALATVVSLRDRATEALRIAEVQRLEKEDTARALDEAFRVAEAVITRCLESVTVLDSRLTEMLSSADASNNSVVSLMRDIEHSRETIPISLENALKPVRESRRRLLELGIGESPVSHDLVPASRTKDIHRLEDQTDRALSAISSLRERLVEAQEVWRLEEEAACRQREEEEVEKLRLAAQSMQVKAYPKTSTQDHRESEVLNSPNSLDVEYKIHATLGPLPEESVNDERPMRPTSPHLVSCLGEDRATTLRDQLEAIGIRNLVYPVDPAAGIPSLEQIAKCQKGVDCVVTGFDTLTVDTHEHQCNTSYDSLRTQIETAQELMQRLHRLGNFADHACQCDGNLSALLDLIDGSASDGINSLAKNKSREVLLHKLREVDRVLETMRTSAESLREDRRVDAEISRIEQAWSELREMAEDVIHGVVSIRPNSVISSGRSSALSSTSDRSLGSRTSKPRLPTSRRQSNPFLVPNAKPSRSVSAFQRVTTPTKPSGRSVSGPLSGWKPNSNSSSTLFNSTHASRSRTTSLTTSDPSLLPSLPSAPSKQRRSTSRQYHRTASPAMSEASSTSYVTKSPSKSPAPRSTFSRAPRMAFGSSSSSRPLPARRKYVADPTSKLDIAVGKVVNNLPLNITIEAATDGWKDMSGKYWIGDENPRLCFCRILRSQTVMVRVGGGWVELSRFIKDHFADAFRILASPVATNEPRWISAAALADTGSSHHGSPERVLPSVPSFALSTPSGRRTPQSLEASPQSGSPLTPFQFMRKAEGHPRTVSGSSSPFKSPKKGRGSLPGTPSFPSAWRP